MEQWTKDINKTFVYILPMYEDIKYFKTILGCYLGDKSKPKIKDRIFMRYKFDGTKNSTYLKFEEEIQKHHLFEDYYDVDKHTVMFVFKIPDEYRYDYDTFIKSKYSRLSENYKKQIIKFHALPKSSKVYKILYNDPVYRKEMEEKIGCEIPKDVEISSCWEEENEYFTQKQEEKGVV